MNSFADLHIHSVFSDGILSPDEIFEKAELYGLSAISITDHDTVDGCIIAESIKVNYNIDFLNGVELSCHFQGKEYHVIGYNLDLNNSKLRQHLATYREARLLRAERILKKLNDFNIPITFDAIMKKAGEAPVARPHIASAMIELGITSNLKEAFLLYLGEGSPAYEAKTQFPIEHAIKLINNCGGIAVLAHPAKSITQEHLYSVIEMGLDGIEVYHPMHDTKQRLYYHSIANQYWLIETGGSDYHGNRDYDEYNFGTAGVPYSTVDAIRKLSSQI
jgi:3',5'-nucleoside bisphosphate phosphatase